MFCIPFPGSLYLSARADYHDGRKEVFSFQWQPLPKEGYGDNRRDEKKGLRWEYILSIIFVYLSASILNAMSQNKATLYSTGSGLSGFRSGFFRIVTNNWLIFWLDLKDNLKTQFFHVIYLVISSKVAALGWSTFSTFLPWSSKSSQSLSAFWVVSPPNVDG